MKNLKYYISLAVILGLVSGGAFAAEKKEAHKEKDKSVKMEQPAKDSSKKAKKVK